MAGAGRNGMGGWRQVRSGTGGIQKKLPRPETYLYPGRVLIIIAQAQGVSLRPRPFPNVFALIQLSKIGAAVLENPR